MSTDNTPTVELDTKTIADLYGRILGGLLASGHYTESSARSGARPLNRTIGAFADSDPAATVDAEKLTRVAIRRIKSAIKAGADKGSYDS